MRILSGSKILVHSRVFGNRLAEERLERFLSPSGIGRDALSVYSDEDVDDILKKEDWARMDRRKGQIPKNEPMTFIFNVFDWDKGTLTDTPITNRLIGRDTSPLKRSLLGVPGAFTFFRDAGARLDNEGRVCQSAYSFHTLWGCTFRCAYCHTSRFIFIMLDVEEMISRLDQLFSVAPWQRIFQFDVHSDALLFEPTYGCVEKLVEFFAGQEERRFMIYTKSNNVDFLLALEHNGKTMICWTMSPDYATRNIEVGAPSMRARLKAAEKCQRAGYEVRFKFMPIIPVEGWRDHARDMLSELFSLVRPTIITLRTLSFMDFSDLYSVFGGKIAWDAPLMEEASRFRGEMVKSPLSPFPHGVRKEIYEFYINEIRKRSSDVIVSICNESIEMWEELGPLLGMNMDTQVCNCASSSIEGGRIVRHVNPVRLT